MSVLHIFLFLSLLYHHGLLVSATSNRVLTKQGYVRGRRQHVQLHNGIQYNIYKFLGVPYVQAPIEKLRFKRPKPLENKRRTDDYDATYYRPICLQVLDNENYLNSTKLAWTGFNTSTDMKEDCLYLNIYTPSTTCTRKYPVMVYIHGGSYVGGTPIRDVSPGEYLPRHGIVLVTIQYRLDAFGFFTTGDSEAPGNVGLLDQVDALKWIQNNIDGFCGDKSSVTLLGEGTGGSSVSLHYLSRLSKGLFHRGIAVSGVALTPSTLRPKSTVLKASKTLSKNLGCEKQNSHLTFQCLRQKSGTAIIAANTDRFNVQPFVDNDFLEDEPRTLLKEGRFQKELPLMSGFVSNEGTLGLKEKPNISNISDYQHFVHKNFFPQLLQRTKEQAPAAFDALAFQYTPWGDLGNPEAFLKNAIDMRGDFLAVAPTHAVLSSHSNQGASTYMFEFAHRSRQHPGENWKGVEHGNATAYKFGLPLLRSAKTDLTFDDDDRSVSKMMVTLLTNFAKTGNPNTPSRVGGVQWTAYKKSNEAYLKIQRKPAMASKYHPLRMAFWNSYFPALFPCTWYGQCKKSEAPKPLQSPNGESNPASPVRGAPNQERVLW